MVNLKKHDIEIEYSFIIPMYNAEHYISRCLKSICQLNRRDIEIIVVDDGSTDSSAEICQELCSCDNRIKYYYKENSGVSDTRNFGLLKSNGKYILFIDSDDCSMITDHFLNENLLNPFDITIFGYSDIVGSKSIVKSPGHLGEHIMTSELFLDLYGKQVMNVPFNKIYKKELIKEGFQSGIKMGEDLIFNLHYLSGCRSVNLINKSYYQYFINDSSASVNPKSFTPSDACALIEALYDYYKSQFYENEDNIIYQLMPVAEEKIYDDLYIVLNAYKKNRNILDNELLRWKDTICGNDIVMSVISGGNISQNITLSFYKWRRFIYNYYRLRIFKVRFYKMISMIFKR